MSFFRQERGREPRPSFSPFSEFLLHLTIGFIIAIGLFSIWHTIIMEICERLGI